MLLDCIFWVGLTTAGVVFILLGCRLVIDFPGLLELDVKTFKEINATEDSFASVKVTKDCACNVSRSSIYHLDNSGESTVPSISPARQSYKEDEPSRPLMTGPRLQRQSNVTAPLVKRPFGGPVKLSNTSRPVANKSDIAIIVTSQPQSSKLVPTQPPTEQSSAASPAADPAPTVGHRMSKTVTCRVVTGQVTRIQVHSDTVSILIKTQEHGPDFSINIDISEEDLSYKDHVERVTVVSEDVPVANDVPEAAQCDLYQTKENDNRHC